MTFQMSPLVVVYFGTNESNESNESHFDQRSILFLFFKFQKDLIPKAPVLWKKERESCDVL